MTTFTSYKCSSIVCQQYTAMIIFLMSLQFSATYKLWWGGEGESRRGGGWASVGDSSAIAVTTGLSWWHFRLVNFHLVLAFKSNRLKYRYHYGELWWVLSYFIYFSAPRVHLSAHCMDYKNIFVLILIAPRKMKTIRGQYSGIY